MLDATTSSNQCPAEGTTAVRVFESDAERTEIHYFAESGGRLREGGGGG